MTLENIKDLFVHMSDLKLSEKETLYNYGMSKMTCPGENEDGPKKYGSIAFVEFIEMIGRVAHRKF
jgi:hypothetical protein